MDGTICKNPVPEAIAFISNFDLLQIMMLYISLIGCYFSKLGGKANYLQYITPLPTKTEHYGDQHNNSTYIVF